jgi:hypothetical protein
LGGAETLVSLVRRILAHDAWATSDGTLETGPFIVRFRTPIVQAGQAQGHRRCLVVCWPYADEGSGAMPTRSDSAAMEVFENRICHAWEHDGLAILAAVLTFDGARQWVFYTEDVGECGERLNAMPQERDPYPIELTTEEDPDWAYLREQILGPVDWEPQQPEWQQSLNSKSA